MKRHAVRTTSSAIEHMRLAIREARRSHHEDDRPHPYVGVVVARNNAVLATAFRGDQAPGDHAEFGALEKKLAAETLAGSTVYTTLEPCTTRNHPKIPCADRLIERRVARVVIGSLDPDQRITGRGVIRLRRAGIAVDLFPPDLMAEIEELNRDFFREREALAAAAPSSSDKLVRDLANWLLNTPIDDPLIRGIALREAGQVSHAIECLEQAIAKAPDYPRYHSNLAHAYARKGDLDSAITHLLSALRIRRESDGVEWPRYHFHLARYYSVRGTPQDLTSATQHLARAVAAGDAWRKAVLRESGLFSGVLDGALSAAKELRGAETACREATLEQIKREMSNAPHVAYAGIYGSYWLNGATRFRDIDICAVTEGINASVQFKSVACCLAQDTPINIYIVPSAILLADIRDATYGQFFSHKFILGAEGVLNEPTLESCVLMVVKQAIQDAVVWRYRQLGEHVFALAYTSDWFLALVLRHRVIRDRTFSRCLRRLFDHHNQDGFSRVRKIYDDALHVLRGQGALAEGPGRDGLWVLDRNSVLNWERAEGATDSQIIERFWQTYESFKGKRSTQRKQGMLERMPLRSVHEIESKLDMLLGEGQVRSRGLTTP